MDTTTLPERVQEVMDALNLNQPQLASLVGVTKGAVNQWVSGHSKSIDAEYAFKLQRKTGYSAEWLIFGIEPKKIPASYLIDNKVAAVITCMENMTEADKDRLVKIGTALVEPNNKKSAQQ
jgi:transcriptional regulator with XRE-family HTH domain